MVTRFIQQMKHSYGFTNIGSYKCVSQTVNYKMLLVCEISFISPQNITEMDSYLHTTFNTEKPIKF
jgi:hypothetical protein